jgi:hypothetical protein
VRRGFLQVFFSVGFETLTTTILAIPRNSSHVLATFIAASMTLGLSWYASCFTGDQGMVIHTPPPRRREMRIFSSSAEEKRTTTMPWIATSMVDELTCSLTCMECRTAGYLSHDFRRYFDPRRTERSPRAMESTILRVARARTIISSMWTTKSPWSLAVSDW